MKIRAETHKVGNEIVVSALVVDGNVTVKPEYFADPLPEDVKLPKEIIHKETFHWGADVSPGVIARETRLLLKDRLAKQPSMVTLPGLDGQEL